MNNFDKWILALLVFNCIVSGVEGNWDAVFGWGAATCFFFAGATKKGDEV